MEMIIVKRLTSSIFLVGSVVLFSGCQPDLPDRQKPKIDINLPTVDSKSLKAIPDYKAIALEWQTIPDAKAKGYYIYRSNMQKDGAKFKRVAILNNKYISHYLDKGLESNSKYSYAISLKGAKGLESNPSSAVVFQTLPALESISLIETISNLPRQIKILWRPHPNPRIKEYIIEKNTPSQGKWEKIATVKDRLNVEYIDDNLGDNEIFMYRIKAVTFDGIVSTASAISQARTKPLPNSVQEFSATKNLPRKIQLLWGRSTTPDVVLYNIYRSSSLDGSFEKIAKIPVDANMYDNIVNEDGKVYFYKITTVDKDGLESSLKDITAIMGATLGKPKMPLVTLAQIQGNKVILNWVAGDKRAVSYNIYKTTQEGWANSTQKLIPNIQALRFEDSDIVRGIEYKYSVQAVDKYGLVSQKTKESTLILPTLAKREK
jgi:fibronectin type 3 domain-containing protein